MLQFVNALLRHRWLVATLPLLLATLVVVIGLLGDRTYTSNVAFSSQSPSGGQLSRLSGIASQFGIGLPTGEVTQSPQFYADLLRSRRVLAATVRSQLEVATGESNSPRSPRTLIQIYEVEGETEPIRVERAVEQLEGLITVNVDSETGVVRLAVQTRWPELSVSVAERMIELVNRFNIETRRTQASEKRQFLTERLSDAKEELRAAEDSLEQFLQNNRRYQSSPPLVFRHERLQRRVNLHQNLVTTLSQSLEQAKIEEVRNTPVITVVEPAEKPARPDPRRLKLQAFLGLVLGIIIALLWAFGRDIAGNTEQRRPSEYENFRHLRQDALDDLKNLPDRLRKLFARLVRRLRP